MVRFTCTTCQTSLDDQDMQKHLSTTRHKSIVHEPTQETLECEQCQDTNIHQLIIIRYAGQDMAMLCQTCFSKETDKPSTQYSLQNGSILKNLENYFKVRDLSCGYCDKDANLYVSKTNVEEVACFKCLKEKGLPMEAYVSENDDTFLYVLLGIKEHVKSSTKKFDRKRKMGRGKKGRFGRGKGRGKPARPPRQNGEGSERPTTLRSFKALDKKEVNKLKPEDEKEVPKEKPKQAAAANLAKINNQKNGPKPDNKRNQNDKKTVNEKSKQSNASSKASLNNKKAKNSDTKHLPSKSVNGSQRTPLPSQAESFSIAQSQISYSRQPIQTRSQGPVHPAFKGGNSSDAPKNQSNEPKAKKFSKPNQTKKQDPEPSTESVTKKFNNLKISSSSSPAAKPSKGNNPKAGKDTAKPSSKSGPTNKVVVSSKSANCKPGNGKANNTKGRTINSKENVKPSPEVTPFVDSKPDRNFLKSVPADEEREEYEHIPKYLANQPKLSYDSLDEYFKEMCYHLYLEEKLETKPIVNFTTEYSQDDNKLIKVNIPYTEEIEKMVPEKFRKLGKLPFTMNQAIFISRSNDKDNIWECYVKDLNVITRGKKKIELLLELYKWNKAGTFPVGSTTLSLVPTSATISRILFAMGRIENPKFIKMLLGKESIKQINFKNFLTFTKDTFNDSQKSAIQHVLNNSITVLQGPPGTGKTSTIYEIILQLLRNLRTFPILVVAASNIAIDNIAEKLKNDKDLTILRIVSNEKNREYNEHHHLSDICLHHKVFNMLPQRFKETALDLRYNRPVSKNQYKKLLTMQSSISDKLISQAQVILTTTVVAGGFQLKSIKKLPVVIMDESTQSSEASTLIPLSMPGVDKFIFVGDDKQLSSFSDIPYLEQSMFERVLKNGTYTKPHMLNVQYRMNPKISAFPIKNFYNNLLSDGVTGEQRSIPGIEPLRFIDHKGEFKESKVSNYRRGGNGGYTYTNKGESDLILRILKHLILEKGIKNENISIITPYSAQRDLVATSIQQDAVVNPENKSIEEEVDEDSLTNKKPTTIKTIVDIMVSSIDAFQGREKDIIIFSCVRSNEENKIGFVKDARRLNVALTRARCGLVLVGDATTMSQGDPLWKNLLGHLDSENMVISTEEYFK